MTEFPAFPAQPGPAPKVRPAVVTVSSALLVAFVALLLVNTVAALVGTTDAVNQTMEDAYKDIPNGDAALDLVKAIQVVSLILNLVAALGFLVLAFFNLKGSNGSRITTWVLAGIGTLCCACGIFGAAAGGGFGGDEASKAAAERVAEAYPSWYQPVTMGAMVLGLLCLIGAIITLALPAANDYFRKTPPEPQFIPPGQQF
ncbi:hypothetical protein [Longispora albida]|uniref:hypothetical protein n=1 Tax=Longispora albida TaxID=203523 RepID=UPI0012F80726|nr:hypothetical protein [Longispora albida]